MFLKAQIGKDTKECPFKNLKIENIKTGRAEETVVALLNFM